MRKKVRSLISLMLPGASEWADRPPDNWVCWKQPKTNKHQMNEGVTRLDLAVRRLMQAGNGPQLRVRDVLKATYSVPCPFWYVRAGAICAFETAWLAENRDRTIRSNDAAIPSIKKISDLAKAAIAPLYQITAIVTR
jgi:hypothetical protein